MKVSSNLVATERDVRKLSSSIEQIAEDLTLPNPEYQNQIRFGRGKRFYKKIDKYLCYLKKIKDSYVIPRYYFEELSIPYEDETVSGRKFKVASRIILRGYQQAFIDANEDSLSHTGILLEAPCGSGKTVLGIWLSLLRGVQTMVLVPTYYLAKQWKLRIEEYTDASVVILSSKDTEIPTDSDFTIVVMDLFACRVLPSELIQNIGHVILDEAHRIGAETYLPILEEIPAKFRTALTATFRRADGVHRILRYHFGTHLKMESRFPRPCIYGVYTGVTVRGALSKNRPYQPFLDFLDRIEVPYHETKSAVSFQPSADMRDMIESQLSDRIINKTVYRQLCTCLKKSSALSYQTVESYLNEHAGRRKMVISIIQYCLDSGRTVLFLSKRKDVLRALHKYFASYKPMLIISETTERTDEEEKYLQNSCPLILGVSQLAKEGLDIDRLDTLILHLPVKDTEQAIGRICRLHPDKKQAVALYLVDNCAVTYSTYNNAKTRYFPINGKFMGERNVKTIKPCL